VPIQSIQSHPGGGPAGRGPRLAGPRSALWAITGAVVVLFAFFLAIGGVDPGDAAAACMIAALLAIAWIAHWWSRSSRGGARLAERGDRERRGF
jgi:hypothetical protein